MADVGGGNGQLMQRVESQPERLRFTTTELTPILEKVKDKTKNDI